MKVAVFSDTHSNNELMLEAVRRCRPDAAYGGCLLAWRLRTHTQRGSNLSGANSEIFPPLTELFFITVM